MYLIICYRVYCALITTNQNTSRPHYPINPPVLLPGQQLSIVADSGVQNLPGGLRLLTPCPWDFLPMAPEPGSWRTEQKELCASASVKSARLEAGITTRSEVIAFWVASPVSFCWKSRCKNSLRDVSHEHELRIMINCFKHCGNWLDLNILYINIPW